MALAAPVLMFLLIGSALGADNSTLANPSSYSKSGPPVGALVGIVVAGLVLVGLVAIPCYTYSKSNSYNVMSDKEYTHKSTHSAPDLKGKKVLSNYAYSNLQSTSTASIAPLTALHLKSIDKDNPIYDIATCDLKDTSSNLEDIHMSC